MYTIYVKSHYYDNPNSMFARYIDFYSNHGYVEFESREEALTYLKDDILDRYWQKHSNGYSVAGTYLLDNGEFDRPDYQVRKLKPEQIKNTSKT